LLPHKWPVPKIWQRLRRQKMLTTGIINQSTEEIIVSFLPSMTELLQRTQYKQ
jgi:hypothetical protein